LFGIPTEKAAEMQKQGIPNNQIISNLKDQGYKHEQISGAMDQLSVKNELSSQAAPGMEPVGEPKIPLALMNAPAPSQQPSPTMEQEPMAPIEPELTAPEPTAGFAPEPLERGSYDAIEEIAESIIKEKWDELVRGVGDIKIWKERVDIDLEGVKQELVRTQDKFEELQKALMGKVKEYGDGVTTIGTEMKALERVLEKILTPLTKSVKDLQTVSEKLSKKRAPRKTTKRKTTKKKKK
jgi:hypothetical protein